jgi:hypothetical protein
VRSTLYISSGSGLERYHCVKKRSMPSRAAGSEKSVVYAFGVSVSMRACRPIDWAAATVAC